MSRRSGQDNSQSATADAALTSVIKRKVTVIDERGMTMLVWSRLIQHLKNFAGKVTISNGAISVDGRSIIELLQLAAVAGTVLTVELVGPDAESIMQQITPLLANGI